MWGRPATSSHQPVSKDLAALTVSPLAPTGDVSSDPTLHSGALAVTSSTSARASARKT